ncbi:MAG: M48 family metallopeptidase [Flavobacteriaceae bacterium]|nr:M48 family metallopeptidase [Flavobacteriaceae bacterium]
MKHETLEFGSKTIAYELTFSDRKTLGISVTPNMDVKVTAPENTSLEKIREKVRKKAPWILKQTSYFLAFHPRTPKKRFVSGESHLYLGRQYKLYVVLGKIEEVRYKGRSIEITTTKKSKAEKLMTVWYRERAKIKFAEIAEPLIERFKKHGVAPSNIYLHDMPKRWGSCTPTGRIILNPELIKAPKHCIEYVIVHELCHLVHRNHNQKFFDLQTKEMPDWRKWKERLERLMA